MVNLLFSVLCGVGVGLYSIYQDEGGKSAENSEPEIVEDNKPQIVKAKRGRKKKTVVASDDKDESLEEVLTQEKDVQNGPKDEIKE